ncbi:MAG: alkaline phosphatase family protein [Prevotella sp.]|nr:alkaline phosphatase family protein [Prevotella sp.]
MNYKFIRFSTIVTIAVCSNSLTAQTLQPAPKLVVNIVVDQLRTDFIEQFSELYSSDGFKHLLTEGTVYEAADYPFKNVDRTSAVAAVATGTTPYYNNIIGTQWIDRNTLRPIQAVDDQKYLYSPAKMLASTISDELKVATSGGAIVYGVAEHKDAAILSAGHAADGAFWIDGNTGKWLTTEYYSHDAISWLMNYSNANPQTPDNKANKNDRIIDLAIACVEGKAMGRDDITDYLAVTLSATSNHTESASDNMEGIYLELDKSIARLVNTIEKNVGSNKVLFVVTSTGYVIEPEPDYAKYKIPTGTFYINRNAQLLNMYLGAIYGQARYVETCFHNQIYLNRKLAEQRHINFSEMLSRSKDFIIQLSGVRAVVDSPYSPNISGDIIVEISPGWQVVNEETGEKFVSRASYVPFPIIFYGAGIKPQRISTPVTVDQIAPTIANAIHIRAPNACSASPLR